MSSYPAEHLKQTRNLLNVKISLEINCVREEYHEGKEDREEIFDHLEVRDAFLEFMSSCFAGYTLDL